MKSRANAMNIDDGALWPDIVVSDRHGVTADAALTSWVADWFRGGAVGGDGLPTGPGAPLSLR